MHTHTCAQSFIPGTDERDTTLAESFQSFMVDIHSRKSMSPRDTSFWTCRVNTRGVVQGQHLPTFIYRHNSCQIRMVHTCHVQCLAVLCSKGQRHGAMLCIQSSHASRLLYGVMHRILKRLIEFAPLHVFSFLCGPGHIKFKTLSLQDCHTVRAPVMISLSAHSFISSVPTTGPHLQICSNQLCSLFRADFETARLYE